MLEIHIKQEKAKSLEESFYIKDSLNLSYKKNTMVLQCDVYFSVIIKDIDPSNFMKHTCPEACGVYLLFAKCFEYCANECCEIQASPQTLVGE